MLASVVIDQVAGELQDPSYVRWSLAKLLDYLSSAQRAVALVRPDATATVAAVLLVAGTKQSLPTGGLRLLKVNRNMGVAGATPGGVIRKVDVETLDNYDQDWHLAAKASATVLEYVYDDRVPKNYYVNPPVPASPAVYAEIAYSVTPAQVTAVGDTLAIDDVYEAALRHWTLYLAYSLNVEQRNAGRAQTHFSGFFSVLGVKIQGDMMVSPNRPGAK